MDDQENDTYSVVAKEGWSDPWGEDEAKEQRNFASIMGRVWLAIVLLILRKYMSAFEFKGERRSSTIFYFGARLR